MSEPARLGVAVLGVGRMGRRHALNVSQTSGVCQHSVVEAQPLLASVDRFLYASSSTRRRMRPD